MLKSRTKMGAMRRGSVMMEFIIVFPIYLILFAATFILGDMLIHSNRLAFGDMMEVFVGDLAVRGKAMEAANARDFYRRYVLHYSKDHDQISNFLPGGSETFQADAGGSWTECAASTFGIYYRPTIGGVLGQLLAAEALIGGTPDRADKVRSAIDDWRDGKFAVMKSKGGNILFGNISGQDVFRPDNDLRSHCFYVLKRNRNSIYAEGKWRWLTSGLLKNNRWLTEVLDDGWHTGDTLKQRYTNSGNDAGCSNIEGYARYNVFENLNRRPE